MLGAFFACNRYELALRTLHGVNNAKLLARFIAINVIGDVLSLKLAANWVSLAFGLALMLIEVGLLFGFNHLAKQRLESILNQGM